MRPRKAAVALGVIAGTVSCSLWAASSQDDGEEGDLSPAEETVEPAIPKSYPVERYLGVWMKSPFQLEAAGEVMVTPQSFARDYVLTGLIQDGELSIAYIQNSKTGESTRLTNEEPADGFELIKTNPSPDPRAASVEVRRGNETATLKYGDETFAQAAVPPSGAPTPNANPAGAQPGRGISPGRSGALPGRPVNSPQARNAGAEGNNDNANNGDSPVVNPAAMRLQQLRDRQQQADGKESESGQSPRSRRRVILPSQSD